jgi:methylated-DNA-[protein]-cysteine S-methyltransferase
MKELTIDRVNSAIGEIIVVTDQEKLCALDFDNYEQRMIKLLQRRFGQVQFNPQKNPLGICDRVQAYLSGDYQSLAEIPVSTGGTAFQHQVWFALRAIPVGTVLTYGQLAAQLGKPTASRAVGMVNSLNPVSIVLPCHRVIGANGHLTGYAGGLERKTWLLKHEGYSLKS